MSAKGRHLLAEFFGYLIDNGQCEDPADQGEDKQFLVLQVLVFDLGVNNNMVSDTNIYQISI